MKRQSDLVRDLTDPGWREREAALNDRILPAIRPANALRGFGVTVMVQGGARRWYIGADGVKRWADNDQPVCAAHQDGGEA